MNTSLSLIHDIFRLYLRCTFFNIKIDYEYRSKSYDYRTMLNSLLQYSIRSNTLTAVI